MFFSRGEKGTIEPDKQRSYPESTATYSRPPLARAQPLNLPGSQWKRRMKQREGGRRRDQARPLPVPRSTPHTTTASRRKKSSKHSNKKASALENVAQSGFRSKIAFLLFRNVVSCPRLQDGAGKRPWIQPRGQIYLAWFQRSLGSFYSYQRLSLHSYSLFHNVNSIYSCQAWTEYQVYSFWNE